MTREKQYPDVGLTTEDVVGLFYEIIDQRINCITDDPKEQAELIAAFEYAMDAMEERDILRKEIDSVLETVEGWRKK